LHFSSSTAEPFVKNLKRGAIEGKEVANLTKMGGGKDRGQKLYYRLTSILTF
jgi:hypothetical protein